MDDVGTRVIMAIACFPIIAVSGFRLSRSRKPYNILVLTNHKLIALAAVILLALIVIQAYRAGDAGAGGIVAAVTTGVLSLGLIATGGILSARAEPPAIVARFHHVAPYVTVLFAAVMLYLALGH